MTIDQCIALFAATATFGGLIFVGLQFRDSTRQRFADALLKILDTNQRLIEIGIHNPELLAILSDQIECTSEVGRRYLQLWVNFFSMVHDFLNHSMLRADARANLECDISANMKSKNMRKHWKEYGNFYPSSFQEYINSVLKKDEPPAKTAHHAKVRHHNHDART